MKRIILPTVLFTLVLTATFLLISDYRHGVSMPSQIALLAGAVIMTSAIWLACVFGCRSGDKK
jgi:hypothetical protein